MSINNKIALTYVKIIRFFRIAIINSFLKILFKKKVSYKKILINRDGAFGDSVVALPALSIVRQNNLSAQIDLLSVNNHGISFKDIGLKENLINNLYAINKNQLKNTLIELKKENYDLFIQIPQNIGTYKTIRNILLVRFYLNISSAFGWDSGRIKSFMRIQKEFLLIQTETNRFIKTLKKHNFDGEPNYPLKSIPPYNQELTKLMLQSKPIAFLIGGKLQPKKWPLHHWITLAKLIGDDKKILILGGNDDKKDAKFIKTQTSNTVDLCGKFTIPELSYVFENIAIAISLDTGGMHLCDAAGAKLVALFSTRDLSNKWYPNNKDTAVIEKVVHCSFCLKTKCDNNICMINISPDEVYSKMNALLIN